MSLTPDDFPPIGPQENPGKIGAAFILAEDRLGRVLCQLRDDFEHVSMPGRWCLFGGGVEPGETLTEAALREFEEETGVLLPAESLTPYAKLLSLNERRNQLFVFRTSVRSLTPADIRVGEGAGFAFWTRAQLAELAFADWLAPVRAHVLAEGSGRAAPGS